MRQAEKHGNNEKNTIYTSVNTGVFRHDELSRENIEKD